MTTEQEADSVGAERRFNTNIFGMAASKYFAIWIWSIVIGIATTTTFSLTNYNVRSRGDFLALLLVPLFLMSATALLAAWLSIIRFFRVYLLPIIFSEGLPPTRHPEYNSLAANALRSAMQFSIIGLAFRLVLSVADIALNSAFVL